MRPKDFAAELSTDWSRWVLQNGLPNLPRSDVAMGDSVPVAYWVGPTTAAVLHVRWNDEVEDDEPPFTESDVELFYLDAGEWEPAGGGGGNWADERPALTRPAVPDDYVAWHGVNGGWIGDRGCKALSGEVGRAAAFIEVEQDGRVTRRPVDSDSGAVVVCGEYDLPMTIRVLDASNRLLAVEEEPAGFGDV